MRKSSIGCFTAHTFLSAYTVFSDIFFIVKHNVSQESQRTTLIVLLICFSTQVTQVILLEERGCSCAQGLIETEQEATANS